MARITIDKATINGDSVEIEGTVDTIAVVIRVWLSHLNTLANKAAKRSYVAQELKRNAPIAPITLDLSGAPIDV